MELKNNKTFRMDLSILPEDIIPNIGKYLLMGYNDKYKFNKIFKKKNDSNLLKFSLVLMVLYLDMLITILEIIKI